MKSLIKKLLDYADVKIDAKIDDRLLQRIDTVGLIDQLFKISELKEEISKKQRKKSQTGKHDILPDFEESAKTRELNKITRNLYTLLQPPTTSNRKQISPHKQDGQSVESTKASLPFLQGILPII